MYFSELKNYDEDSFLENKQRISLSSFAFDMLQNDRSVFDASIANGDNQIVSSYICRIYLNYREQAEASVFSTLNKEAAKDRKALIHVPESTQKEEIISALLTEKEAELMKNIKSLTGNKAVPLQIRLNRQVMDYLASEDGQQEGRYYHDRIGLYLKAVLEEYCCLPFVERERVYFQELIQTVQSAVFAERQLKLETHQPTDSERNTIRIKPLCIQYDTARQYNYLAGMVSFDNGCSWTPGSLRLTSIKRFRQLSEHSFISQADREAIENGIQNRGIQFLSSQTGIETIVVRLTEQGRQLYKRILNQRPALAKKQNDDLYEFQCTVFQAEHYFFRFGQEAVIIQPESLKETLRKRYEAALQVYHSCT